MNGKFWGRVEYRLIKRSKKCNVRCKCKTPGKGRAYKCTDGSRKSCGKASVCKSKRSFSKSKERGCKKIVHRCKCAQPGKSPTYKCTNNKRYSCASSRVCNSKKSFKMSSRRKMCKVVRKKKPKKKPKKKVKCGCFAKTESKCSDGCTWDSGKCTPSCGDAFEKKDCKTKPGCRWQADFWTCENKNDVSQFKQCFPKKEVKKRKKVDLSSWHSKCSRRKVRELNCKKGYKERICNVHGADSKVLSCKNNRNIIHILDGHRCDLHHVLKYTCRK